MPKTVLLVDDETVVVEIAKRKLEDKGYHVLTAFDGDEALEVVSQHKPDLIFLDIQMPKMNGYTFLVEMRKIKGMETIPVVVITAYGEMEGIFRRRGITEYLFKPLKLQDMLAKVDQILIK
jgi:CheY-like chemotaxis protein